METFAYIAGYGWGRFKLNKPDYGDICIYTWVWGQL